MTTEPDSGVYAGATARPTYTRRSDQARYDAQAINHTIDEALYCHVGYVVDRAPVVVPVLHARVGETLYLHTSTDSRLERLAAGRKGTRVCVTITLIDGLVFARSQYGHNVNYRSVVARGDAVLTTDPDEKRQVLAAVVDHLAAGRSRQSRPPTEAELAAVALLRLPLDDVSLKARTGPPNDDGADLGLHYWAGVIGIRNDYGPAFPAPELPYDRSVPKELGNYNRSARSR